MLFAHPTLQTVSARLSCVAAGWIAPGVRSRRGSPIFTIDAPGVGGTAPAGEVGTATPPDVNQRKPRPKPPTTRSTAMAMIARLRLDNAAVGTYLTVMLVWASPDRSPSEHVIRTGH